MYKGKKIAVVVPAYNEEKQIIKVIQSMPDFVDHIIVCDDASRDKTVEVVKSLQKSSSRTILLCLEVNEGVGGAIALGYAWARDNDMDVAVVMAGDGQMDPIDLPKILDPVVYGHCDYSKANRLFSGQAYKKIPKIRYFGNSTLSFLTKIVSGYWHIADSQSGYTAINRRALHQLDWTKMYKRYGQPNDLLVRLNTLNFRVQDVHVEPVYRVGEQSKMKIRKVTFTLSWLLIRLFFWRLKEKYIIRDFHPLVFFYALGVALLTASLFFLGQLVLKWHHDGFAPPMTSLALTFCFATGLQSIFFAMWFDMESNKELKGV